MEKNGNFQSVSRNMQSKPNHTGHQRKADREEPRQSIQSSSLGNPNLPEQDGGVRSVGNKPSCHATDASS